MLDPLLDPCTCGTLDESSPACAAGAKEATVKLAAAPRASTRRETPRLKIRVIYRNFQLEVISSAH